ncbi:Ppx/GppA family phosphatase, partial [Aliarcobacter butzleri]
PSLEVVQWMSFMISLNIAINQDFSRPKVEYILENKTLKINLPNKSFLIESNIDKIETPQDLILEIL